MCSRLKTYIKKENNNTEASEACSPRRTWNFGIYFFFFTCQTCYNFLLKINFLKKIVTVRKFKKNIYLYTKNENNKAGNEDKIYPFEFEP